MDLLFCFELTSFRGLEVHSGDGQWCRKNVQKQKCF